MGDQMKLALPGIGPGHNGADEAPGLEVRQAIRLFCPGALVRLEFRFAKTHCVMFTEHETPNIFRARSSADRRWWRTGRQGRASFNNNQNQAIA